ncbi:MAG: hypothetical protein R3E66_10915 [bacterium]
MVSAGLKSGDRATILSPNRVEDFGRAGHPSGWWRDGSSTRTSTADQIGYIVKHSDARVLFVDTPALLARLYEAWGDSRRRQKIVLFSDDLDPVKVLHELRVFRSKGAKLRRGRTSRDFVARGAGDWRGA